MNENPSAGFGEVSRMVGIEWKRLSNEQKRQYETRAQFIAEERAKAELLTPTSKMPQVARIHPIHLVIRSLCKISPAKFESTAVAGNNVITNLTAKTASMRTLGYRILHNYVISK
jgi:hypothetical protein